MIPPDSTETYSILLTIYHKSKESATIICGQSLLSDLAPDVRSRILDDEAGKCFCILIF